MSTVFEELSELEAKREAAFEQTVDQICRDAGRASKELASIVDKRKRLLARQSEVAKLDDLLAERTDLQQQIADANAELDRRVAEHQSKCLPLQHRISDINGEMGRLSQLKTQLAAGQF